MITGSTLSSLVDTLQSLGRYTFTREEALASLGSSPAALKQAAERLIRARRLAMPRRGFFVIVPLEHRIAGAPPPSWYVADLLRHAEVRGYVGLLSAAALHGAAHHAVQEFQVIVDRQLRPLTVGRARLHFVLKRGAADTPVRAWKTDTGTMPVSTPEATALDLLEHLDAVGGVDAAATVLDELAERMDPTALAAAAQEAPRAAGQRLGWILDRLGHEDRAQPLHEALALRSPHVVNLRPEAPRTGAADPRWRVRVDRDLEVDT